MLETSTDFLLIVLALCAVGLTVFLCYLLLALVKIVQESTKTVEDVNKKLEKVDPMVDTTTKTVDSLMETIQAINTGVLKPVASFSKVIKTARQAASVFGEKTKTKKKK